MPTIHVETNLDACRELWETSVSPDSLTDLWEVRHCFHQQYQRKPLFVVAKEGPNIVGLIPLSYVEEHGYYGYFPGEIWQGKTWLEQNRLIARDPNVLAKMTKWLWDQKIPYHLRYLCHNPHLVGMPAVEDEIGYLFHPESVHFSMEEYYSLFSKKTLKNIRREIEKMYARNLTIRRHEDDDFDKMIVLNIERFGTQSYFANNKFVGAFRAFKELLSQKGWLKMTSVLIDGRVAAVDMGCVYNGVYTLLSGGTHPDYPGVAKVINLFHLEESCREHYKEVDFLCGDFTWKKMFHLTPRPLYKMECLTGKDSSCELSVKDNAYSDVR